MELAYTQAYYRENIFPSLRPHQKVLLVPVSCVQPTLYLASCRRLGMAYSCRCSVFVRTPVHKRMALLPPLQGTFACTDLGLAASDTEVALKLELYLKWAESDERIIGFNPCKRALCVVDEQWMSLSTQSKARNPMPGLTHTYIYIYGVIYVQGT